MELTQYMKPNFLKLKCLHLFQVDKLFPGLWNSSWEEIVAEGSDDVKENILVT